MRPSSHSFVTPHLLAGCLAAAVGFGTASRAGWPWPLRLTTAAIALLLVALAFRRESIGRWLGGRFERFLAEPHGPKTQRRCLTSALLATGVGIGLLPFGGGQWALALVCIALGAMAFYWGTKVCPSSRAKRAAAGIAIGGYLLSLSANFVAGAAAGQTSLERSLGIIERGTSHIAEDTAQLKHSNARIEERQAEHGRQLQRVLEHLERTPGAAAPAALPPEVLAAAEDLLKSRSARDRAASAIVLGRWDLADTELADLQADPAAAETFEVKMLVGRRLKAAGLYDEAIAPLEFAYRLRPDNYSARDQLAMALLFSRKRTPAMRQRAIELLEGCLHLPGLTPLQKGYTQQALGMAWSTDPSGKEPGDSDKAIAYFEAALTVLTRDASPGGWSLTQGTLADEWIIRPKGNKAENLQRGIALYEELLTFFTRDSNPKMWAWSHQAIGMALAELQREDERNRCDILRRSIASYKAAMLVYSQGDEYSDSRRSLQTLLDIQTRRYDRFGCGRTGTPADAIAPAN